METFSIKSHTPTWATFNFLASLINGNDHAVVRRKNCLIVLSFNFLASLINGNVRKRV